MKTIPKKTKQISDIIMIWR